MNFIFDIGNVLINFHPEAFVHSLLDDAQAEEVMLRTIFHSREWLKLDEGTITPKEAVAAFCGREPAYRETIERVFERIPDMLTPIQETIDLLPAVKAAGHGLYFLSNYHKSFRAYIWEKYPFFGLFDGGVFSCDVKFIKPDRRIYECLLEKYALDAGDCVFFDDMWENVRAAEAVGLRGVVFTGVEDVRRFL